MQTATAREVLLLFMRRKNTTSEMMKLYIIESLLLLLEHKDFQSITISEITVKAGVNRSTYYRHFKSKEEIVFCFLDGIMEAYLEQCKTKKQTLEPYLREMFSFFLSYKKELLLLYHNGLSLILLDVLNKHFSEVITSDMPLVEQYRAIYHIGGIFNHFIFWFSRDMKDAPDELINAALKILPPGFVPYLLNQDN